jgi:hypothetical protein
MPVSSLPSVFGVFQSTQYICKRSYNIKFTPYQFSRYPISTEEAVVIAAAPASGKGRHQTQLSYVVDLPGAPPLKVIPDVDENDEFEDV